MESDYVVSAQVLLHGLCRTREVKSPKCLRRLELRFIILLCHENVTAVRMLKSEMYSPALDREAFYRQ